MPKQQATNPLDPTAVRRLVVESRAAQGLPPQVEDEAALRSIADLIGDPKKVVS